MLTTNVDLPKRSTARTPYPRALSLPTTRVTTPISVIQRSTSAPGAIPCQPETRSLSASRATTSTSIQSPSSHVLITRPDQPESQNSELLPGPLMGGAEASTSGTRTPASPGPEMSTSRLIPQSSDNTVIPSTRPSETFETADTLNNPEPFDKPENTFYTEF